MYKNKNGSNFSYIPEMASGLIREVVADREAKWNGYRYWSTVYLKNCYHLFFPTLFYKNCAFENFTIQFSGAQMPTSAMIN